MGNSNCLSQGVFFRQEERRKYRHQTRGFKQNKAYSSKATSNGKKVKRVGVSSNRANAQNFVMPSNRANIQDARVYNRSDLSLNAKQIIIFCSVTALLIGGASTSHVEEESTTLQRECDSFNLAVGSCNSLSSQEGIVSETIKQKKDLATMCVTDVKTQVSLSNNKMKEYARAIGDNLQEQVDVVGNNTVTTAKDGLKFADQTVAKEESKIEEIKENTDHRLESAYNATQDLKILAENMTDEVKDTLVDIKSIATSILSNGTSDMVASIHELNDTFRESFNDFIENVTSHFNRSISVKVNSLKEDINDTVSFGQEVVDVGQSTIKKYQDFNLSEELYSEINDFYQKHPWHEIKARIAKIEGSEVEEEFMFWFEKVYVTITAAFGILFCFQKRNILKDEVDVCEYFNEYEKNISKFMSLKSKLGLTGKSDIQKFQHEFSKDELCLLVIESEKILAGLKVLKNKITAVVD